MRKRPITAADLMRDLSTDAQYQGKLAQKNSQNQATVDQERLLMAELERFGIKGESLAGLVGASAPLSGPLADVLVRLLKRDDLRAMQESIVRALRAAGESFDATPLVDVFESTDSPSIRWAVANTLAELRPLNLAPWLEKAFGNRAYGDARQMLALAIGRSLPIETASRMLREAYDELPGHAAMALGECGGKREAEFLRDRLPRASGWIKNEIGRALTAIGKRDAAQRDRDERA